MNNQHQHRRVERQATGQMRSAGLRHLARSDLSAPPPASAAPYAGERRIGDSFKPLTQRYAYYAPETKAAMVIMLLALIIAVLTPYWLGWTLFSVAVTVLALVAVPFVPAGVPVLIAASAAVVIGLRGGRPGATAPPPDPATDGDVIP